MNWIKNNPYIALALGIVGMAFVIALFSYLTRENERHEENLVNSGVVKERAEANAEVLNRVEKANDAERNPDPVLTDRVRCKYDRNASTSCK